MDAARPVSARISLDMTRATASPSNPSATRPAATSGSRLWAAASAVASSAACDCIAQFGCGAGAMMEKIALGDHCRVAVPAASPDTQVPDTEPVHAPQRAIDHLVAGTWRAPVCSSPPTPESRPDRCEDPSWRPAESRSVDDYRPATAPRPRTRSAPIRCSAMSRAASRIVPAGGIDRGGVLITSSSRRR